MTGETVLEIVHILRACGVEAWIDGGWGVDALLGTQSRPHDDLDLVVALADVPRIREILEARGFVLGEDQLPVRFTLVHTECVPSTSIRCRSSATAAVCNRSTTAVFFATHPRVS